MNDIAIEALDPDYEPPLPAIPSLTAFGYRRAYRSMWICLSCGSLYERGKPYASSQLCRCRLTKPQPTWQRYEFNQRARLCRCCQAHVLPSGSKWSTWFCEGCSKYVGWFNDTFDATVIPSGAHTLMLRQGHDLGRPREDEDSEAFADRLWTGMNAMSAAIDVLEIHEAHMLVDQLAKAGLIAGRDVRLLDYLRVVARWDAWALTLACFDALTKRFEEGLPDLAI